MIVLRQDVLHLKDVVEKNSAEIRDCHNVVLAVQSNVNGCFDEDLIPDEVVETECAVTRETIACLKREVDAIGEEVLKTW